MAREKALDVATRRAQAWILGADTVVVVDDQILGKPRDAADAKRMLLALSGRQHDVFTAFAVVAPERRIFAERIVRTIVRFRSISKAEIDEYVQSREPFGKAGAYAVQGAARAFVAELRGSHSNVVGLPIDEVREVLRGAGVWTEKPTA